MKVNQTIYHDSDQNAIRYSKVKGVSAEILFSGVSLKYLISGSGEYVANNRKYNLSANEYIIGNDYTSGEVSFKDKTHTIGLCIDISGEVIRVVANYYELSACHFKEFLLSDQFLVNKYLARNNQLGCLLKKIHMGIINDHIENSLLNQELFYDLAEALIADQRFVFEHLNKMNFKKKMY